MTDSSFKPKNMKDLEDIIHNPERVEDKKKYLSNNQTKIFGRSHEKEIKKIFKNMEFIKIGKKETKTFDFIENKKQILSEITSINFGVDTDFKNLNTKAKISKAITHLGDKDSSEYPDFTRGGVIFYDSSLASLIDDLVDDIQNSEFIETQMDMNQLDYLLFKPTDVSDNGPFRRELPTILYVKKNESIKFQNLDGITLRKI